MSKVFCCEQEHCADPTGVLRRERLAKRGDRVSAFQMECTPSGSPDPRIGRAKLSSFAAVLRIAHRDRSDHSIAGVT
jgi:hypothetical protein